MEKEPCEKKGRIELSVNQGKMPQNKPTLIAT
jgi:hypothetical protein